MIASGRDADYRVGDRGKRVAATVVGGRMVHGEGAA
jgi:hypothetical protein